MEKEQKLLCKCLEIFGTDNPEQWKKIMKKADTIRRMYRKGVSVARIARELSVSRPTVYRYVEEIRRSMWKIVRISFP